MSHVEKQNKKDDGKDKRQNEFLEHDDQNSNWQEVTQAKQNERDHWHPHQKRRARGTFENRVFFHAAYLLSACN
jgi:hypothetical protein